MNYTYCVPFWQLIPHIAEEGTIIKDINDQLLQVRGVHPRGDGLVVERVDPDNLPHSCPNCEMHLKNCLNYSLGKDPKKKPYFIKEDDTTK